MPLIILLRRISLPINLPTQLLMHRSSRLQESHLSNRQNQPMFGVLAYLALLLSLLIIILSGIIIIMSKLMQVMHSIARRCPPLHVLCSLRQPFNNNQQPHLMLNNKHNHLVSSIKRYTVRNPPPIPVLPLPHLLQILRIIMFPIR